VTIAGAACEYAIMRYANGKNAKVSEAVLVTCFLFTLTLPPATPYWVAVIGIVFGVFFGKGVFGGFGKNIFNPALVGRCFIYISFPSHMTISWTKPFSGFPGGFLRYFAGMDAVTSATPMIALKKTGEAAGYLELFLGNISGSLGETSALLILLSAAYLVYTKTASWKIMLSCSASLIILNSILYFSGIVKHDPLFSVLSGGFLFAVVYMATDPVSAPSNETSKVIYGALIGTVAMVIRSFSLFAEGIMFAILIGNTFAPLIDKHVKDFEAKRKVAA
ncbi:MAG: RnfABCDGE type electron transport complex subunit D, partial [Clostridia bacterium]|nr:RnfABCDGE type electron transport complex subunit D [Clostridia bacterium]